MDVNLLRSRELRPALTTMKDGNYVNYVLFDEVNNHERRARDKQFPNPVHSAYVP